ncbi:MAG TPA: YCF48-related protein, partial [Anaerolineales bacterium]
MNRKLIFPIFVLVLAILACILPALTSKSPIQATTTAVPVTLLNTATAPKLPVVASPQISDLQMLDASNGWAIGNGTIMRTDDGGTTWYDASPSGISSLDVTAGRFFLDASNGWVTISGTSLTTGTLYHTTDGGHTWSSTTIPFGGASLLFVDPTDGWALVGLGAGMSHEAVAVFRTGDSGNTWNQVFIDDPTVSGSSDSLPLVGDKNGIIALDRNRGWVTGEQPSSDFIYVYLSQDGGSSWTQQNIAMPSGYSGAMTNAFLPR